MTNKKRSTTAIEWPSAGHFTIKDIFKKYPDMVKITVRFRVQKALTNNEISVIGKIKPPIGRPQLVFVKGAVTKEAIDVATKTGVLPIKDTTPVAVAEAAPQENPSVESTVRVSEKVEA